MCGRVEYVDSVWRVGYVVRQCVESGVCSETVGGRVGYVYVYSKFHLVIKFTNNKT